MRLRRIAVVLSVVAPALASHCRAQCAGQTCPGPVACNQTCTVYCQQQLLDALACYAQNPSRSCSHIIIPSGTTLNLCQGIVLTSAHDNLHLTIEGTLKWYGNTSDSTCFAPVMITVDGASGIVIDGDGNGARLVTSNYTVCQEWELAPGSDPFQICDPQICTDPVGSPIRIADAIKITNAAHNITIEGLNFNHIGWMVDCPSNSHVYAIHLKDLNAQNLGGYGAFVDADHTVTVENCHVQNAYGQHGFRFYGDDVTILNSSATNSGSTGFWIVNGEHFKADGFVSTGQRAEVGPIPFAGSAAERVRDVDIRNVDINGTTPCGDIKNAG